MEKRIYFSSQSLGDTIAWIPYVEEYRKINACDVILGCNFSEYFDNVYPNLSFVDPIQMKEDGFDIDVGLHWTRKANEQLFPNLSVHPVDYRLIPLQQVAADLLHVPYQEIRPRIDTKNSPRRISEKYVCIAVQSTLQCKYWNNPLGWQEVVDFLTQRGYKVVLIDQYYSFGSKDDDVWNYPPSGVIDKTSQDLDLWDRIIDLTYADFFIGLGSGLSWLSWAVGTHCFLISGFSKPFCEFQSNVTRINNPNVCHGCFNDEDVPYEFHDWMWCPRYKGTPQAFECTASITGQDVISKIKAYLI